MNAYLKWYLPIFLSLGCHRSNAFEIMYPNGSSAMAVECESYQRCQEEIGEVCERGYNILDYSVTNETEATEVKTKEFSSFRLREGETLTVAFTCRETSKKETWWYR
jgi:hypothetical protein